MVREIVKYIWHTLKGHFMKYISDERARREARVKKASNIATAIGYLLTAWQIIEILFF